MSDIKNAVIKITSIEEDNGRYKIKDEHNKSYSFFKTLSGKDDLTQAYSHFTYNNHNGAFKVGDTVKIGYSEKPGTDRSGKPITYKNIVSFFPAEPSSQPVVVAHPAPVAEPYESRNQFGKRLALHGMVNGMLAADTKPLEVILELPNLLKLEDAIEAILIKQPATELPIIQQDDDIKVEDIPF